MIHLCSNLTFTPLIYIANKAVWCGFGGWGWYLNQLQSFFSNPCDPRKPLAQTATRWLGQTYQRQIRALVENTLNLIFLFRASTSFPPWLSFFHSLLRLPRPKEKASAVFFALVMIMMDWMKPIYSIMKTVRAIQELLIIHTNSNCHPLANLPGYNQKKLERDS